MTVLVVEDDEDTRAMIVMILECEGYTASCASNGAEALRFMRSHGKIDLLLTDIMMPVIDGCVLVDMMRSEATLADIPVVMMTAATPPQLPRDVTLLKKPFRLHELLDAVRAHRRHSSELPTLTRHPASLPPPSSDAGDVLAQHATSC